jgi:hypothetical protein
VFITKSFCYQRLLQKRQNLIISSFMAKGLLENTDRIINKIIVLQRSTIGFFIKTILGPVDLNSQRQL